MLNGNEPLPCTFSFSCQRLGGREGGISDRKSGIGCIWVMVHILQKRKLLHIWMQFHFFCQIVCFCSLFYILIFSTIDQPTRRIICLEFTRQVLPKIHKCKVEIMAPYPLHSIYRFRKLHSTLQTHD